MDSGGVNLTGKLNTIQKGCLKVIDCKHHPGASAVDNSCQVYSHSSLVDRHNKHWLAVMYRHAQKKSYLENQHSKI